MLVAAARAVEDAGGTFVLAGPTATVRRVFDILHLADVVTVVETRQAALDEIARSRPPRRAERAMARRRGDRQLPQRRRLLAGAILAAVALAALAALFSWRQYDDAKKHALNEIEARVVLGKTVFDTYFAGEIAVLQSVAVVRGGHLRRHDRDGPYFKRVQPPKGKQFSGGLGWVDLDGRVRASSSTSPARPRRQRRRPRLLQDGGRDRQALHQRRSRGQAGKRRLIVMAVPTFDRQNKLNGVLAGALNLTPSQSNRQTIDLGYEGLSIIDRKGQNIMTPNFARPANTALLATMRRSKAGLLPDTKGLNGSGGRIVAYTTSPLPGWITVIDRSPAAVFASARRSLELELGSIVAAALLVIGLLVWLYRRANRNAFAERRRTRIASDLTRSLAEASTPGAAAGALAAALAAGQPEALAVVGLPEEGNPGLTLAASRGTTVPALDRGRESLLEPAAAAYESGEALQISGQTEVADRFPDLQRDSARHVGALYAAPIVGSSGRRLGAVLLLFESPRRLGENDRAQIAAHVEQAVQALARTLRQEREHEVAVELQRSLLPEELPASDGVEFATRYHAGGVGVEVGGDWFDVVRRPDGLLHVSVGDVAGRGIPAATLMAQLRNAFRAYALDHDSPAEVTRRLLRHVPEGGMVTTACLTIDPCTRRYRTRSPATRRSCSSTARPARSSTWPRPERRRSASRARRRSARRRGAPVARDADRLHGRPRRAAGSQHRRRHRSRLVRSGLGRRGHGRGPCRRRPRRRDGRSAAPTTTPR